MLFHFLLISIPGVFIYNDSARGEDTGLLAVRIDGYNTVLFNQEYPERSLNIFSLISGNPYDRFPGDMLFPVTNQPAFQNCFLRGSYTDSLLHIHVTGTLGSETGDPLLNMFDKRYKSKDHFTKFGIACAFPHIPLSMYGAYRYIDNYSTSFNQKWKDYSAGTGTEMAFSQEGLAHELVTGYSLKGTAALTGLQTTTYKRWEATPFYFSPLYSSGYILFPYLSFALPRSQISFHLVYDYHKDYYNHNDYSEVTDHLWDITWQRQFSRGAGIKISQRKNSTLNPSLATHVQVNDTVTNLLYWDISGYIFSNFRPGGSLAIHYNQFPNFLLSLNTAWDFIPQTREYTFWENATPVDYRSTMYDAVSFHSSLTYTDTLLFPLSASVWFHYQEKPQRETIEYTATRNIIRREEIANSSQMTSGGKGSYTITFRKFSALLWGNATITPKKKIVQFSLPLSMGADICYGKPDNDSLYAALKFENRARTAITYLNKNENEILTFSSPAFTRFTGTIKIPFLLPYVGKYIRTTVQIEAGPFYFAESQYIQEHPRGNPIGPMVSVLLNGFFH